MESREQSLLPRIAINERIYERARKCRELRPGRRPREMVGAALPGIQVILPCATDCPPLLISGRNLAGTGSLSASEVPEPSGATAATAKPRSVCAVRRCCFE